MHPIITTVLGQPIYSYGAALGIAFITGWSLATRFTNREGIPYKFATTAYTLAIIFALIGARVFELLANPEMWRFKGFLVALFASKCEGLVAYGGYIGASLACFFYARMKRQDFWSLADCTAPSMMLGLGITRIGCFFAGCCHGQPTELPWGIVFPPGSPAARAFPDLAHRAGEAVSSLPVHPTQLYESLLGFALFPIAYLAYRKRRFTGQALLITIPLYAIGRFLLEIIRGDTDRGEVAHLSTSQFIGIALVLFAIGAYLYRRKKAPAPPPPLSKEEIERRLLEAGAKKSKKKSR